MNQQATLEIAPALRAPRAARAFVADILTAWDVQVERIEAAQLVVSELVTNAVLHAADSPTISVDLRLTEGAVQVLVSDGGLGEPERHPLPDPRTAETGRGVWLIDAFSERWGTETHPDGKTVWCELSIKPSTNR